MPWCNVSTSGSRACHEYFNLVPARISRMISKFMFVMFCPGRAKNPSCKIVLNSVLAGGARLDLSPSAVLKTPPKRSGEVPSSQAHCMPSREGSWSLSDGMLVGAGSAQRSCTSCATGCLSIHALQARYLECCCHSTVDCATIPWCGNPGYFLPLHCDLGLHCCRSKS